MGHEQVSEQAESAVAPEPAASPARTTAALDGPLTPQAVLALQRAAGNRATTSALARRTLARAPGRRHCAPEEVRTPDDGEHITADGCRFIMAADRESDNWWTSTAGGEVGH